MAGETALARQLKKLSVPQTAVLTQDKIRKSFLFDHRDAASLDRDLIFAYGVTGFEKLCLISPLFEKYGKNLFSSKYKDFERSVQTADVNKKLDAKINDFITLLSPYFLIRAAHEALEWLIYRFHIHLYNTDALVCAALPHYNSTVFVRVVQLLVLDDVHSRWFWLNPIQKSGSHLEYSAILNRFNSDGGFRKLICDLAPKILMVYGAENEAIAAPIISFSTLTVYYALDRCKNVGNSLILFLLPYILKGLSSCVNKYSASTYLIISKIVVSVKLSDKIVQELLIKIFQNLNNDLMKEALELMRLIYQQQAINSFPKKIFSSFLRNSESFCTCLNMLVQKYESSNFLLIILKENLKRMFPVNLNANKKMLNEKQFEICEQLLSNVKLDEKCVVKYFKFLLKFYYQKLQKIKSKKLKMSLKDKVKFVIKSLELKYPAYFDKALNMFMQKKSPFKNKITKKLINASVCSLKFKVLQDAKTTLVLGLTHQNQHIRSQSIKMMLLEVAEGVEHDEFMKELLYDRLFDESNEIVEELLSFPEVLILVLGKEKVLNAILNIASKEFQFDSKWYPVHMQCLNILCSCFSDASEQEFDVFLAIVPYLLPLRLPSLKSFLFVLNSDLVQMFPFLEDVKRSFQLSKVGQKINQSKEIEQVKIKEDELVIINSAVISALKCYVNQLGNRQKDFMSYFYEKCSKFKVSSVSVIYVFLVRHLIITETDDTQRCIYVQYFLKYYYFLISRMNVTFQNFDASLTEDSVVKKWICFEDNNMLPSILFDFCLWDILKSLKLQFCFTEYLFSNENESLISRYRILATLYEFWIHHINCKNVLLVENSKQMLSNFFSHQFKNLQQMFWFLSVTWLNVSENISQGLQVSAIRNACLIFSNEKNMSWLLDNPLYLLVIMHTVSSAVDEIRQSALALMSSILQHVDAGQNRWILLFQEICLNSEEIQTDCRQLYYVLSNWLSPAVEGLISNHPEMNSKIEILDILLKLLSEKSTPYLLRHFILKCLENLDSIKLLLAYVPVLKEVLVDCKSVAKESHIDFITLLLKKFTPLTAKALTDGKVADVLIDYLQTTVQDNIETHKPIHLIALDVLSKDFFSALPSELLQKKILEIVLNLYINSKSKDDAKIGKTLRKLCTFAYLLLRDFEFGDEKASKIVTTLREAKRTKLDKLEKEVSFDSSSWKQIIVLLEVVQSKSGLDKKELLIPILFNLLNKTLSVENQLRLEYLRQLILSTIHNCCEQLGTAGLDERQFRVEVIVQCIRTSTSPKTHHQSLLLLNLAASMFPQYVLNNVMSIFTFMGNTLVRQDNSYSFQVISQTIETIVPAFLEASSQQTEGESTQAVAAMIRVFVDSLVDIPGHRQLPLFTKLLTTLDPSKYLWIPLAQICDQYASVFHDIVLEDVNNCKISPTLEFAVSLHKGFSPRDQIITCINLLNFVKQLPDFKADFDPKQHLNCKEPFDVANHSEKQLQVYKQNILSYMNIWLSSPMFIIQISELNSKDLASLKGEYENLLEITLNYLQHALQLQLSYAKSKPELNNLVLLLYDLVSHINSLLPIELFIRVIRRLLRHKEHAIQNKAIELLNAKVEQQYHLFTDENSLLLLKVMKPLIKIVTLEGEDRTNLNQQAALYALQLLTQKIGLRYPAKFYKVLNVTVNILSNVSESSELTLNALLCLAQLCNCLNVAVLPHINSFMPIVVDLVGSRGVNDGDECLVLAVITVIQSLVENLGAFLSSFMQSLVYQISLLCAKYSETGKKSICEKLKTTQVLLSKEIALRVLLTAIADSYTKLQSDNKTAIIALMQILDEKLNFSSYDDVTACSPQLQKFYISVLDFRHLNSVDEVAQNMINIVEDSIINTLKTFVMKLSVTHFRNFFQKLYQWSSAAEEDKYHVHKTFTFYKITFELSKSLKNLFVTMSKVFLRQAASLLDLNNSSKNQSSFFENNESMSSQLLSHILDTLNFCFLYDDGKLLDKEYFDAVMQPTVDQLENLSADDYQERIEKHLASCIAHLMGAVSDNNLWKKLNYQILLKTRHDSPKVRFAALQVIREVVKEMGDNYLVLLPESIPFLAEMMEDESSEVEEECQSVIIEMEKILGEPIRKYF